MVEIYMITNNLNGKRYVGQTTKGYLNRFQAHCNARQHGRNTYIGNAIHKYGKQYFSVELLRTVSDNTWMLWEKYYIKKYQTLFSQWGYNITPGGDSNPMSIPEVRERHLKSCRTADHREKLSQAGYRQITTQVKRDKIRANNLRNVVAITRGLRRYNESKKIRVGIIEDEKVVLEFDSLSDACRFVGTTAKNAGCILRRCDMYNKNGKRAKMYGYSWTKL